MSKSSNIFELVKDGRRNSDVRELQERQNQSSFNLQAIVLQTPLRILGAMSRSRKTQPKNLDWPSRKGENMKRIFTSLASGRIAGICVGRSVRSHPNHQSRDARKHASVGAGSVRSSASPGTGGTATPERLWISGRP